MKRKILVPMFASVMALSMNTMANADEVNKDIVTDTESKVDDTLELGEYVETTYKKAVVKEGVGVKIRQEGSVQQVAYSGDEFKVIATQGEWVEVVVGETNGWLPARFVEVQEAFGFTSEDKVNFRKEANTDSEIIEELSIGSAVTVLENNGDWIKVKKGESEGYIRALYVSETAPVIEVEEEVQPITNDVTTNNNNNTQSSNNNIPSNNRPSNNQINRPNNNQGQKPSQGGSYNPPAANTSAAQAVVNLAYSKIGSPYVWGAEGPNSFDCSGLTSYVYRNAAGISLPRTSSAQSGYGKTVSKANLQPGDLVFFTTNGTGGVSHVGIYVGGGNMVHSPAPGQNVHVASINSSYYAGRFVTAKRVL
ncbi:MAG: NlpC/P60 family protein [Romboutsia sp.]